MTGVTDSTEQDELEAGLQSRFWGRLRAHYEREWGPAGERYQQAIAQAIGAGKDADDAVHGLRMVVFAQKELARVLAWPEERVAQLKRKTWDAAAGPVSRRGPGL